MWTHNFFIALFINHLLSSYFLLKLGNWGLKHHFSATKIMCIFLVRFLILNWCVVVNNLLFASDRNLIQTNLRKSDYFSSCNWEVKGAPCLRNSKILGINGWHLRYSLFLPWPLPSFLAVSFRFWGGLYPSDSKNGPYILQIFEKIPCHLSIFFIFETLAFFQLHNKGSQKNKNAFT